MARDMASKRNILFRERGRKCEKCGYDGYLELHHIKPVVDGGDNKNGNLIILCEVCHAEVHGTTKKKYFDKRRKNWIG